MAIWADDADLTTYEINIVADLPSGQADWSAEIAKAQGDILERIKNDWWESHVASKYFDTTSGYPIMDEALLNVAALKQITCYQSFAYYIMPKLARFSDEDDAYTRKIAFYSSEVEREYSKIKNMALYDFNSDSTFSDYERTGPVTRRLARA